jgi:hypothetical protein
MFKNLDSVRIELIISEPQMASLTDNVALFLHTKKTANNCRITLGYIYIIRTCFFSMQIFI